MLAPTTTEPRRIDYLDALRAWAILGVIGIHTMQATADAGAASPPLAQRFFTCGALGVQLFFVVSAFTLLHAADRNRDRFDARSFFIRRACRILPVYYLGIIAYGISYILRDRQFSPGGFVTSFFFLNFVRPGWIAAYPPGGWSIVAEVDFYLLFPLVVRYITTAKRGTMLLLVTTVAGLAFTWYLRSDYLVSALHAFGREMPAEERRHMHNWSYFLFTNQACIFAIGLLAYFIYRDYLRRAPNAVGWTLQLASVLAMAAFVVFGPLGIAEHWLFGLAFGVLLLGTATVHNPVLVNPVTILLGQLSYSMYIVHFAVVDVLHPYVDRMSGWSGIWLCFAVVVPITTALAWLCHRWIEAPMIALGKRLTAKPQTEPEKAD